jgi:hypothetical protein
MGTHRAQARSFPLDSHRVHRGHNSETMRAAWCHRWVSPRSIPRVSLVRAVLIPSHGMPPMSPSTAGSSRAVAMSAWRGVSGQ